MKKWKHHYISNHETNLWTFFYYLKIRTISNHSLNITDENKQPSFYAVLLENGSHDIIIDFGKEKGDEKSFMKTLYKWNATEYPPITFLKESVPFRVILGFKKGKFMVPCINLNHLK